MKRRQRIYQSEQVILDKIDAERANAVKLNAEAEMCEFGSQNLFKQSYEAMSKAKTADEIRVANRLKHEAENLKEHARKCRKSARRIEEVRLPALGDALSAFRTETLMPIMGNYKGVASTV